MRGVGRLARLLRNVADLLQPGEKRLPLILTETQKAFVDWNAERLGIASDECLRRYRRSWDALPGGHAGNTFRAWDTTLCEVANVLIDDSTKEVFGAYQFLAPFTLLRLLSYREPVWSETDVLFRDLAARQRVHIVDFGCGLAQNSRALATALVARGVGVRMTLTDIRTITTDFLLYLVKRQGIAAQFLDCTPARPIPELTSCDVVFAQEFFEHVYDPVAYLDALDRALEPGGFIITNVADHQAEMFHVRPDLSEVRARLARLGYAELSTNLLFRKSI
jgi:2-polyprenyl-3-methyl-5-hydroxy-6-metoxy-1,4-benzoquinol methylase